MMDAEQLTRGQLESEFSALARTMYFSRSTIASFAKEATRGQLVAVCDLIRGENATREENKKARLLRQARFPSLKSFSDFDFSEVSMPDGYTVDDMRSLGFIESAQDFVFYGGCGRGKTHLSIALEILATERGYKVRSVETSSLVLMLKAAAADGRLEAALKALRHIVLCEGRDLFRFSLSDESCRRLGGVAQAYVMQCLDKPFKTQEFLDTILS